MRTFLILLFIVEFSFSTNSAFGMEPSLPLIKACYQNLNFINHDNSNNSRSNDQGPAAVFASRQGKKGILLFEKSWISFCELPPELLKMSAASTSSTIEVVDANHKAQTFVTLPDASKPGQFLQKAEAPTPKSQKIECVAAKDNDSVKEIINSLSDDVEKSYSGFQKQSEFSKGSTPPPSLYAATLSVCRGIDAKLDKLINKEINKFPLSPAEKAATTKVAH
jgi:hypothetical protein